MADLFLNNICLILFLPLWIFLILMVGRFFSVYVNNRIIYGLTLLSSFAGALLSAGALWKLPTSKIFEFETPFIKINDFIISCGIHVDRASLIFALVLFLVSFLVQLYATSYMKSEKKNYRFFALLNLFNFAMAGLFFSPNLFQTYFFWEIVGIVSYLLIGFDYSKKSKSIAARKVFIINRVGDTALISAILICSYFMYTYAPNKSLTTLSFVDLNVISTLVYAYTSTPLFWLICGLFIIGALVKSAQFPFYNWLQDAMEAKLPVSALLHSATMVALGVYLTYRLIPFYTLEALLPKSIAIIGLTTALVCSLSACSQTNPKKTLAYSTSAQLGLMFFSLGMLNIKAAIAYFIAHAFIKSMLFLSLPKEEKPWNYICFVGFLVSGLSLSGLIFSGLITKEAISLNLNTSLTTIFSLISFITAFYIIRIALIVAEKQGLEKNKIDNKELCSIILLLLLNISYYFYLRNKIEYSVAESFWAALIAWICVYVLFIKKAFWKVPILYQLTYNGFYLDKFYISCCAKFYSKFADFCNFIDKNVFSNYFFPIQISKVSVKAFGFIEEKIMNGTVNLITESCKNISILDNKAQTGNIQRYNAYAFIIITAILTCIILAYTLMISYVGG